MKRFYFDFRVVLPGDLFSKPTSLVFVLTCRCLGCLYFVSSANLVSCQVRQFVMM